MKQKKSKKNPAKTSLKDKDIVIVGAGLVGTLLGLALSRRGYKRIQILEKQGEKASSFSSKTHFSGYSINLALSERGLKPLRDLKLDQEILKLCVPMYGRMIHSKKGKLSFQVYGKTSEALYSIPRSLFIHRLLHFAKKEKNLKIHFGVPLEKIDLKNNQIVSGKKTFSFNCLIGTDGAFSKVRKILKKDQILKTEEKTSHFFYKEVSLFPPFAFYKEKNLYKKQMSDLYDWPIEQKKISSDQISFMFNTLHIWPRNEYMMVGLPHLDGHFTATLFMPLEGKKSFQFFKKKEDVFSFFQTEFPDLLDWEKSETNLFLKSSPNPLIGIKTKPWFFEDKILLIGDASHAMWPFLGQGMNAGFEDVRIFLEILDQSEKKNEKEKNALKDVFKTFFQSRFPNTSALSHMSEENEYEMRYLVSKPSFLLKKKVDLLLEKNFPETYKSTYRLLAFTHTAYKDIQMRKNRQEKVLNQICKGLEKIENLDLERAKDILDQNAREPN